MSYGPLNDCAHSLDIVVAEGRVVRVERAVEPTDPAAYEAHHGDARTLIQDDDVFDAVSVGIGCMGIIWTALLEVEPKYYLREVRELHPWAKVNLALHLKPSLAPFMVETAMTALVKDEYDEASFKVFNIGNANLVPA